MKMDPKVEVSQFVTFMINEEMFGVLIQAVEEIITLPEKITPVPKAPFYFSGMINLRGEVISVINLRRRFNLNEAEPTEMTRILIVSISDVKIGMIVDVVSRVLPVASRDVRPPPALMENSKAKYLFGSVQFDNSVMLLLDTDDLISEEELSFYQKQKAEDVTGSEKALQISHRGDEHILIGFKLRHENYAIDINYVEEIIELPKITPVPEMEHLIDGIFHQRDRALPILQLHRRFHLKKEKITEDNPVLIVNEGGLVIGFIVDEITEVFRVFDDDIVTPPANLSGKSAEQLEGIIKIKKKDEETKVVMALNVSQILTDEEQDYLRELHEELNDIEEESTENGMGSEIISILKFRVGNEIFCIRVPEINEITTMQKMVTIPRTPPFVNGVINLRGDVITILDLAKMFENEANEANEHTRIIIVEIDEQKAGFQVDQILGIDHVPYSLFEKPSGLIRGQYNQFIEGIGREPDKNEVIILMDVRETLTRSEMYEGDWGNLLLEAPAS